MEVLVVQRRSNNLSRLEERSQRKKREKNRRRNERNKVNPVYQARKKERDRQRRNAKKHKRDQANREYQERKKIRQKGRKNAKKHDRDKANLEYQARKNAKKHQREKANREYQERKNKKRHDKRATYSNKVVEYERILKNGHDRVCVCCGQLFAEIGIVVNAQQCILAIEKDPQLIVLRHIVWIPELQLCITCIQAIGKGKVPKTLLKTTPQLNLRWKKRPGRNTSTLGKKTFQKSSHILASENMTRTSTKKCKISLVLTLLLEASWCQSTWKMECSSS